MAQDGVLPIVFTDYLIAVPKDYCNTARKVPDFVQSVFGLSIDAKTCQMSDVGHAGVLFWDAFGRTRYAEFGRYASGPGGKEIGITRFAAGGVPDLKLRADGTPEPVALKRTLDVVSKKGGHSSRISGVLIAVPGKYKAMLKYCETRARAKGGAGANDYSVFANNCGTFVADVLLSADVKVEKSAQPDDFLRWLQKRHPKVEYAPRARKLCVDGVVSEGGCI